MNGVRERERENKIQLWHVHVTNRDQHPSPYAARELRSIVVVGSLRRISHYTPPS